eukprot:scaffold442_cov397-Prasinococcus_capsulatus_cf.AAC.10
MPPLLLNGRLGGAAAASVAGAAASSSPPPSSSSSSAPANGAPAAAEAARREGATSGARPALLPQSGVRTGGDGRARGGGRAVGRRTLVAALGGGGLAGVGWREVIPSVRGGTWMGRCTSPCCSGIKVGAGRPASVY